MKPTRMPCFLSALRALADLSVPPSSPGAEFSRVSHPACRSFSADVVVLRPYTQSQHSQWGWGHVNLRSFPPAVKKGGQTTQPYR